MAAPGSRAVLLSTLAVLALPGTTQALFGKFFSVRPPTPPSPLQFLEASGCVPDNFTAELPEAVTAAGEACAPKREAVTAAGEACAPKPRFGRSPRGGGRGGHHGGKAQLMQCVASQLNVTNDSGVDETALDSLLDSLSSNTTFTDQLKANADTCLAAMNTTTLTVDQQGVYVLACLKHQLATDCARQGENTTLCLNAKTLIGKCPIGLRTLVSGTGWYTCKRQAKASMISSTMSSVFSGSFSPSSLDPDSMCPKMDENARSLANCSLQAASLASGDTMDLTAVQTAIDASAVTSDAEKALQSAVLETCTANGADTVDAFLDCWAEQSADGCCTSGAARMALSYTGTTSSGGSFGGGGGGCFGGRPSFSGGRRNSRRGRRTRNFSPSRRGRGRRTRNFG